MYFINPFKGLRPTKENASSVAVSSTDHLSKDSVVDHKNNNSWSYLNVFGEKDSSKSKEQFELMKKKSILKKDKFVSFATIDFSFINSNCSFDFCLFSALKTFK